MDKKTIALVIVVCAVVFSIGIFAGRFIMLTETPVHRATPSPAITPVPTPLEEIYKEFYYDILGWENVYGYRYGSTGSRFECIKQNDEEEPRQALKDFDTIIKKFINNVKKNGYESQVEEEFIYYHNLLALHATFRYVDRMDIVELCDYLAPDIPDFVSDLKEELIEFIS